MKKEKLNKLLKSIESSFLMASEVDVEVKGKAWKNFWIKKVDATLESFEVRIKSLSEGILQVYDKETEPKRFWKEIIKNVKNNIWTTNITKTSKSTFGSDLDSLLILQKEAIDRNVNIHRVFVYNPDNRTQLSLIKNIMMNQLYYKINVHVITERALDAIIMKLGGSESTERDFMIIDDVFLYETTYNEESDSFRNSLFSSSNRVEFMKKIRTATMKKAKEITFKNISDFPDLL